MIEIVSSDQMRSIDQRAIEQFRIPGSILMENAGIRAADILLEHFPEAERVAIVCGKGNNGGDGFVVARHLQSSGLEVIVLMSAAVDELDDAAKVNAQICESLPIELINVADGVSVEAMEALDETDVIVDALLGTGLNRAAEGLARSLIETINLADKPVVSLDVPSGLDASLSQPVGPNVEAALTVTFCRPKTCTVLDPAASSCGDVVVVDISIPDEAVEQEGVGLFLGSPDLVSTAWPKRDSGWHKGTSGRIGIFAGSAGRSGAAALATRAALRSGGGLVTLVSDQTTTSIVDGLSTESMSRAVDVTNAAEIRSALDGSDVVLIGPGLADDQHDLIRELVETIDSATVMVIDATALNALAPVEKSLGPENSVRVLTPHPGEMARLLGISTDRVQSDRLECIRQLAQRSGSLVVLKGHQTLIADPNGNVVVNLTGNPSMAIGGMGDALAGMIATALAQTHGEPLLAVAGAVWLHGFAGDLLDGETGPGITALDLVESIPVALRKVRQL